MTVTTNPVVTGIQTGASFANPTATLGLTAVNGSATTGLRSDGAPALSQAIVPTWTGTHTFNNTIVGNVSGLAGTATALATPRAINGTNFDGTANITVTAAAGTLTGGTLASGVTASSLTSVGTLTSLTLAGAVTGATALTTTGSTILGDAQTDTLNVGAGDIIKDASGNTGFGVSPSTKIDMFGGYALFRNASYQIYLGTGLLTTGGVAADGCIRCDTGQILMSFSGTTRFTLSSAGLLTSGSTTLQATSVALANGAAASVGTLTNAPAAGNPTKWVPINDNGTTRYIPAW